MSNCGPEWADGRDVFAWRDPGSKCRPAVKGERFITFSEYGEARPTTIPKGDDQVIPDIAIKDLRGALP